MSVYIKIFLVWCSLLCTTDVLAQRKHECDSILHRVHNKLGSFYSRSTGSTGYAFDITVSATYRDKTIGNVKPQHYHMAIANGMLLFESENLDSFQDDSIRISVIKTQNRIYIGDSDQVDATVSYMDQFNAVQKILPQFASVHHCNEVDGKIHLLTTIKADTLGLDQVKSMAYVIDRKTYVIRQIAFDFIESNPIITYSIAYSDIIQPYAIPPEVIRRYIDLAQRSASGLKQFEQYSIIDNRKKVNP